MTLSPGLNPLARSPTDRTIPEISLPRIVGSSSGQNAFMAPLRSLKSIGLTLLAATRTNTSPSPATGSGTSSKFHLSGPPYSCKTTAFIDSPQRECRHVHPDIPIRLDERREILVVCRRTLILH